jgi:hypothetical protein
MSHLLLSHLSQENNKPEIVTSLFDTFPTETHIIIASRHRESELFEISNPQSPAPTFRLRIKPSAKQQLTLF